MNTSKCCRNRNLELSNRAHFARLLSLLLASVCLLWTGAALATTKERIAVLPFEIVDNTPVPGGEARNRQMLNKLTQFVGESIEQSGLFDVVPQAEVNSAVRSAELGTYIHTCNRCEVELAQKVAGDKVMVGWIYKMSVLILTMHIQVKDVASDRILVSKAYDFRGDNEKAWLRAAQYMVRDLERMLGK